MGDDTYVNIFKRFFEDLRWDKGSPRGDQIPV